MLKRFFPLFIISLLVLLPLRGQKTVFSDGFEQASLPGWVNDSGSTFIPWHVVSSGIYNLSAAQGDNYVGLFATAPQGATRLISPLVDVSGLENGQLSFWSAQPSFVNGDFDTLRVYGRVRETDSWEVLEELSQCEATWSYHQIDLVDVSNSTFQFCFEYCYGGGRGIALDAVMVGNESICSQPDNLGVYRLTDDQAEIMWHAAEESLSYRIKVSTHLLSDMEQVGDVVDSVVYFKPYCLSGLSALTRYYVYVQADCGDGDVSSWSDVLTFTTKCAPFSLPITEGFDMTGSSSGQFPSCWSRLMSYSGDWDGATPNADCTPSCNSSFKHSGSSALKLFAYYNSTIASTPRITQCAVVSPKMLVDSVQDLQISFWSHMGSLSSCLQLGLMSDPTDLSTFELLSEIRPSALSCWEEFIVPFTMSVTNGKYVAFLLDGADVKLTQTVYIDDVSIDVIPACPKPTKIETSSLSDVEVTLNWLSTKASSWHVKVNSKLMSDMTRAGDIADIQSSSCPITITGLRPETTYYAYVQSDCGGDGSSSWSNAYCFTTLCSPVVAFPFEESFEQVPNGDIPNCWQKIATHSTYPYVADGSSNASDGKKSLKFSSSSSEPAYAMTPVFGSNIKALQLNFDVKLESTSKSGVLEVGVMSNASDTSTFELVKQISPSSTLFESHEIYFNMISGSGEHSCIAFRQRSKSSNWYYWLDAIVVDSVSSCLPPADVRICSQSSSETLLCWSSSSTGASYHVKVSTSALLNPSVDVPDVYMGAVEGDSLLLRSLKMGCDYYVYIQSVCDDEMSHWQLYYFQTPCGSITSLPYDDSFQVQGMGTGVMAPCWSRWSPGLTASPYVTSTCDCTGDANSGSLYFNNSGDSVLLGIMPPLAVDDVSIQDLQLSFSLKGSSSGGDAVVLGVMSDALDYSTFEALDTFYATSSFQEVYDVDFSTYRGRGRYIAFCSKGGFRHSTYNVVYIDDVRLDLASTCKEPVGVQVYGLTDSSASLCWQSRGSVSGYEVAIGSPGFNPDTLSCLQRVGGERLVLNDLQPKTAYQVYVRSVCGESGVSTWSRDCRFVTKQRAETLPLLSDFENEADNLKWELLNGDQMNHFVIGDKAKKDGRLGLYVSNVSNVSGDYKYSTGTDSYVYAQRLFRFEKGVYKVEYDWQCSGETNYDLGRVCLVDTSVVLTGGKAFGMTGSSNKLPIGWRALDGGGLSQSSSWKHESVLFEVLSDNVYNVVVFWKNDHSGGSQPPLAIDNLVIDQMHCVPVGDIEVQSSDTSIALSWQNLTHAPYWDVRVTAQPMHHSVLDTLQNCLFSDTVCSNSCNVGGLEPKHVYYAYVRTHCADGSVEKWSEVLAPTECVAVNRLPYVEDFESYSELGLNFPLCWSAVHGSSSSPILRTNFNHSVDGKSSLYMSCSSTVDNLVATPCIASDAIRDLKLSCYVYGSSERKTVVVGVMDNVYDDKSFVAVDTLVISESSVWEYHEVLFNRYQGKGKYVAFRIGNSSYSIYLDDVRLEDCRMCQQPVNLALSHLSSQSAKLSWSVGGGLYNLKLSTHPIDPYIESGDVLTVSDLQDAYVSLTDLDANTTYYFYVQGFCDDSLSSYWSDVFEFTTLCEEFALPYTDDFSSYEYSVPLLPSCYSYVNDVAGEVAVAGVPLVVKGESVDGDSMSLQLVSYYSDAVNDFGSLKSIVSLPMLKGDLNSVVLSFSHFSLTPDAMLQVGVMSDVMDASSFQLIDSVKLGSWNRSFIDFSSCGVQHGFIAFKIDGSLNQHSVVAYIDDIRVDSVQYLRGAKDVNSRNVNGRGAELYWTSMLPTDSVWHVQVSKVPLDLKSLCLDNYKDFEVDTLVYGYSLMLNSLNERTTYYYYLRLVDDKSDHSICAPLWGEFRTLCDSVTIPYVEPFDSYDLDVDVLPEGWFVDSTNASTEVLPCLSSVHSSGSGSLHFKSLSGSYAYAVLPALTVESMSDLELSFMANGMTTASAVTIGVMGDKDDFMSFDALQTVALSMNSGWHSVSCSLSSYSGDGGYVAIVCDLRDRSGVNEFYIDDILVQRSGSCSRPLNLFLKEKSQTTASFVWPSSPVAADYDLAVLPEGSDFDSLFIYSVHGIDFQVVGLTASTTYDAYVRVHCGDAVSAWRGPLTFMTLPVAGSVPYVCQFESGRDGWLFANGKQKNQFYIGNAASANGYGSLYISNTQGLTNTYDVNQSSTVYAYRLFHFDYGEYELMYDWLCKGESYSDYGRAYLAPKSSAFKAGTNVMNSTTSSVPTNWIEVDGGKMSGQGESWQHNRTTFRITTSDDYYLVFGWFNNGSSGSKPSLTIDNVRLVAEDCYAPFVMLDSVNDHAVYVNLKGCGDSMELKLSTLPMSLTTIDYYQGDVYDGKVASGEEMFDGLTPSRNYYLYCRSFCDVGVVSEWSSFSFTTACVPTLINDSLIYTDNFDSYQTITDMLCWRMSDSYNETKPTLTSSISSSTTNSLRLNASAGRSCYAVTPRMEGHAMNDLMVRFKGYKKSGNNALLVGVMSDPNDISTFEVVDSINFQSNLSWKEQVVPLNCYTGTGHYVAFVKPLAMSVDFYIDDVVIEPLSRCLAPNHLSITEVTSTTAKIGWRSVLRDDSCYLKVFSSLSAQVSGRGDVFDGVVASDHLLVTGLLPNHSYKVCVCSVCSHSATSEWSDFVSFTTDCGVEGVPYSQNFAGHFLPNCWSRYSGLIGSSVIVANSSWVTTTDKGLRGKHAKLNIWGTDVCDWLVTPKLAITAPTILNFDLALTKSNVGDAVTNMGSQKDDRFMVVVSRNGGKSWDLSHGLEWSNTGHSDFVYNRISSTGETFHLDLSAYVGDTIVVGFYGESTKNGGDNDLHLGNVVFNQLASVSYCDTICQGYSYSGFGFNVLGSDLPTSGDYQFKRVGKSASGQDTLLFLNLHVRSNTKCVIDATICPGEAYNQFGFNASSSGTYYQNSISSYGCDSVTYLNLKVLDGGVVSTSIVSVCQKNLPFGWRKKMYSESGIYYDTLKNSLGCDSIKALKLTVCPEYHVYDQLSLNDVDLPYSYLDTTFTSSTPVGTSTYVLRRHTWAGCDSVVTLTINIANTHVGLTDIASGKFDMYPNPASVDEWITIDAAVGSDELEGMVVELFNSVGECIKMLHPVSLPVQFSGFTASGVYMVRVTTGTGKVVWSKLVIR